jgi:hypothetical protein
MRKLFLAALLLSLSVCAFAQQDYVGRFDVFTGFSYLDSPKLDLEQHGFNTQIGYNARRWLALGLDYSIQFGHASLVPSDLSKGLFLRERVGRFLRLLPVALGKRSLPATSSGRLSTQPPRHLLLDRSLITVTSRR